MLPMPTASPSAFAAFASQLRGPPLPPSPSLTHLLQLPQFQSILQNQVAAIQNQQLAFMQNEAPAKSPKTPTYNNNRKRVGGSTMKTAKVWRFFDELPSTEQAAECRLCRKKIKATNSSTTGMIRHLRSCHVVEYQLVQEARQTSLLLKLEEKAKVQSFRDASGDSSVEAVVHKKKEAEGQKSPSASSSASETASSTASSTCVYNPELPQGIHAPRPVKVLKQESTEVENSMDQDQPTDLTCKSSAFSTIQKKESMPQEQHHDDDEAKKLNAQIALMILMDQLPPQIVDRPGFRQLIRFLNPQHQLPYSNTFQSELIPEIMQQIRQFGTMMMINNPVMNPFRAMQSVLSPPIVSSVNTSFGSDTSKVEVEDLKRGEDSDSASSADTEGEMTTRVGRLANFLGAQSFQKEEFASVMAVCHSIFSYFEDRPSLLAQLSLSLPSLDPSVPSLLRELQFVGEHSETINSYIRATPDMELLPISDAQSKLLTTLLCPSPIIEV